MSNAKKDLVPVQAAVIPIVKKGAGLNGFRLTAALRPASPSIEEGA